MESASGRIELQIRKSAFNKRIHTFSLVNNEHIDIDDFLNDAFDLYHAEMGEILNKHNMVKSYAIFVAEFEKDVQSTDENGQPGGEVQKVKETAYFHTSNVLISVDVDLNKHYNDKIIEEVREGVENSAFRGSGFTLSRIIRMDIQICSYEPLEGSSFIELPLQLQSKKAIVNVQNEDDNMCFKWAILSAIYGERYPRNANRLNHYLKHRNELVFDGIHFPVRLNQIDKFEEQNKDISVHVYYYDDDKGADKAQVLPIRISKNIKKKHIHLLLLMDDKNYVRVHGACTTAAKIKSMLKNDNNNNGRQQIRTHYCWIKDLSRLVSNQLNNHGHKNYICDRCLNFFQEERLLINHSETCTNEYRIQMPLPYERWITFKNLNYQSKAPFIIYADTEALLKRLNADEQSEVFKKKKEIRTVAYQEHHVYSVGYYFKCEFDDSLSFYATSGNRINCIEWFIEQLEAISQSVANMLLKNERIKPLTNEELSELNNPHVKCSICKQPFEPNEMRVRDHCHFTGKYRGPAHNDCNLNYQESRVIPVIMHNLSGYDAHLFIKKLAKGLSGKLSIIPVNAEQYISFTKEVDSSMRDYPESREKKAKNNKKRAYMGNKIKLKFIDSCRFMAASLSHLASLIPSEKKRILYAECGKNYSLEQMAMLERKGVFPYDYVDNIERLSETALPTMDQFYSELNQEPILPEEYEFACHVWDKFQIKTLGEYSELYLKTDVLLLADVFENFRDTCHTIYELDPAHYYTAPGLSFDAMLKYTNVNIELIADVDMLLFVERGVRGGISQCSQRYVEANNKYMGKSYKPDENPNYLMYLDGKSIHNYNNNYYIN